MKFSRCLLGLIPILALVAQTAVASPHLLPDCDSTSILQDSGAITVDIDCTPNDNVNNADTEVSVTYVQFLLNSDTVIVVDPEGIEFSGPCTGLDTYPLSDLFDEIAEAAVIDAIESGKVASSSNCSSPSHIDVYIPTCVTTTGSGSSTAYTNVDDCDQSIRDVEHCLVSSVGSAGVRGTTSCTTSCSTGESTCSDSPGGGLD